MARASAGAPSFPDPVLLLLISLGVLQVPWFLFGPDGPVSSWFLQTVIDATTIWLAVRLFRLVGRGHPGRRFWAGVGAGMTSCGMGDSCQTIIVLTRHTLDINVFQTIMVVCGMAIIMITTLCHPLGGVGRQRLRLWLDAMTVLVAVAVFLWYFLIAAQLRVGTVTDRVAAAASAAVMLIVTFGLIKLIFSTTAPFTRSAGIVGIIGASGTAVGTPVGMLIGRSDPRLMFVAQLLSCLLIPISLRLQEVQARRHGQRATIDVPRGFNRLPYLAVAAIQILLVAVVLPKGGADLRIWGVAAGGMLITGLVLARQVAAFNDNERLVRELDASMHRLSGQKEWFSALVQHASDLTVVTAEDGRTVRYASPAAERVLGRPAEQLAGEPLSGWAHPDDLPVWQHLADRLAASPGTDADGEIRLRHADGTYRWLHVIGTDLRGNPNVGGIVINGRDVTDARRLQDDLRHQATHDALTGLANRVLLQQRLSGTAPGTPVCMLLLDLDGFKHVNDVHGHHAGDLVLVTVAERITAVLAGNGTVARLGGDEFAVLLPDTDRTRAGALADLLSAAVAEPIAVAETTVRVGTSIGVAAGTAADAERLLREADAAMYRSKQLRRAAV